MTPGSQLRRQADATGEAGRVRREPGRGLLAILPALLCTLAVSACGANYSAERSASAPAQGLTSVRLIGDAGELAIVGEPGRATIAATGTARATSRQRLDELQFRVTTSGTEVLIEARAPGINSGFDATLSVPEDLAVTVVNGAGNITVRNVAGASATVGAGVIRISDIVNDAAVGSVGAGDIRIGEVGGDVDVGNVGVGNIDVTNAAGDVVVGQLGTGNVTITGIGGSVRVGSVGTGNVTVTTVAGNLTVGSVGLGNITHRDVRGSVDVR